MDCKKWMVKMVGTVTIYCPKCGNLYELFYNAGIPVWGCQRCRDKQILVWSDRKISTDEKREAIS